MLAGKPAQIYIEEQELGQESIKGPSVEMSVSPPYPGFPKHEPLPPIVLDNAACPYCGVVQDPPPTRRKKCQDCKETIYTWTDQESRRKYLLTQQDTTESLSKSGTPNGSLSTHRLSTGAKPKIGTQSKWHISGKP